MKRYIYSLVMLIFSFFCSTMLSYANYKIRSESSMVDNLSYPICVELINIYAIVNVKLTYFFH